MDDAFADLFEANERYAAVEHEVADSGVASRGLAIVTCIDSRIDPLAVFGLEPGDAKITATPERVSRMMSSVPWRWRSPPSASRASPSCSTRTAR